MHAGFSSPLAPIDSKSFRKTAGGNGIPFDSRESLTALWKGVSSSVKCADDGGPEVPSKNMSTAKQALRMMEH